MSQWIAGVSTGHNAGVCLLKDGEIIFSVEEERLSKAKHDGGPILSMMKILDYTDKIDYLVVAGLKHHPDAEPPSLIEYSGESLYQGIARRLGLIEQHYDIQRQVNAQSPQVINMSDNHHQLHSSIAFYNSGFETAVSVIVDSCGSCTKFSQIEHIKGRPENLGDKNIYFETESFFDCSYEKGITPILKKMMCDNGKSFTIEKNYGFGGQRDANPYKLVADEVAGIGKVWDAVTDYCGFHINECGKTMGLSAYGCENDEMPDLFRDDDTANRDLVKAYYPHRSELNLFKYRFLNDADWSNDDDLTKSKCRRDLAFKVQKETQEQVLNLILEASEMSGRKNVVLSGGYALNCVSNYYYLDKLKEHDIHLYVEPNSSDAGTATGAALLYHYDINKDISKRKRIKSLCLGPEYNYSIDEISEKLQKYNDGVESEARYSRIFDCTYKDVAELIKDGNIVSIFQGRSENGPRALGNRSILFNPTIKNGKDIVNKVKGREYFRPFAASVMKEYAHEWFDMRGLEESPHMMYAVDVKEDKKDLIPAVLHVDDTCRIQTVSKEGNEHYYNLIEEFYKLTDIPLLFNTSFNLAGYPLVESIDDALKVLNDSEMEYCFMPELNSLIRL
jgi:carbamoyltransferase